MTALTAHTRLRPGAGDTGQVILIAASRISGGVTGPAGESQIGFAGMKRSPARSKTKCRVPEIILI